MLWLFQPSFRQRRDFQRRAPLKTDWLVWQSGQSDPRVQEQGCRQPYLELWQGGLTRPDVRRSRQIRQLERLERIERRIKLFSGRMQKQRRSDFAGARMPR